MPLSVQCSSGAQLQNKILQRGKEWTKREKKKKSPTEKSINEMQRTGNRINFSFFFFFRHAMYSRFFRFSFAHICRQNAVRLPPPTTNKRRQWSIFSSDFFPISFSHFFSVFIRRWFFRLLRVSTLRIHRQSDDNISPQKKTALSSVRSFVLPKRINNARTEEDWVLWCEAWRVFESRCVTSHSCPLRPFPVCVWVHCICRRMRFFIFHNTQIKYKHFEG